MGSDWMREKGLTAPVEEGMSKAIGDTIGMVGPMGFSKAGSQAIIEGGKKLKGLPVGMSIKDVSGAYPQAEALALAQQRAALPRSQGGLGLPENNTAMQRAREMGFETAPSKTTYHASRVDVPAQIDPSMSDFGFHTGTLDQAQSRVKAFANPTEVYPEGANVMPLMMHKYTNALKVADEGTFHADALAPQFAKKGLIDKDYAKRAVKEIDSDYSKRALYDQKMRDVAMQNDIDALKYSNAQEGAGMSYAFNNPEVLRSRFAAFDPFRKTAATAAAMGVAAPDLLAQERNK
jgi:hypothetical protein